MAQETERAAASDTAEGAAGIIVTAERRETRLQDTPLAISVVSGADLAAQQLNTARDLAGRIPNVIIPRTFLSQSAQSFFIRGLGENDPTADPAVGVYIDDIYVPRLYGVLTDFGDVERVEVLRGPQGTLYGRNTSGGAIRIITRDPDDSRTGSLRLGAGDRGQLEAHGYISSPIVPGRLFASLAASHREHDGYVYNATLQRRVNDLDVTSVRGKLRFVASDRLEFQLTGDHTWDNSTTMPRIPRVQPGGYDPAVTYAEFAPDGSLRSGGVSLRSLYTLSDAVTFKSVSSWRFFEFGPMAQDGDGEALQKVTSVNRYRQHAVSQEFQLLGDSVGIDWVLGAFLLREGFRANRTAFNNGYLGVLPRVQRSNVVTHSAALFGQATVELVSHLSLVGGLRLTYDKRSFDYEVLLADIAGNPKISLFTVDTKKSWDALTPKIGFNYDVSRDVFVYLSYSRGFKAGGFDRSTNIASDAAAPFGPEKVSAYEGGIKSVLLGGALTANLAGFYNDINGLQSSVFVAATNSFRRGNAGTARAWGFELETVLVPIKTVSWRNSAGYTHGRYLDFPEPAGPGTTAAGNRIAFVPDWTLNSELSVEPDLGIPGKVRAIGSVQYQSASFADVLNTPQARLPAQAFVNGSVSYRTENGRWTFGVTAKNISNRRRPQFATYSPTLNYVSNSDPRTILATASFQF